MVRYCTHGRHSISALFLGVAAYFIIAPQQHFAPLRQCPSTHKRNTYSPANQMWPFARLHACTPARLHACTPARLHACTPANTSTSAQVLVESYKTLAKCSSGNHLKDLNCRHCVLIVISLKKLICKDAGSKLDSSY